MRRSAELMGGRGGRKGGGLFGGVMESTAKLINSTDIDVKFKYVCLFLNVEPVFPFLVYSSVKQRIFEF